MTERNHTSFSSRTLMSPRSICWSKGYCWYKAGMSERPAASSTNVRTTAGRATEYTRDKRLAAYAGHSLSFVSVT